MAAEKWKNKGSEIDMEKLKIESGDQAYSEDLIPESDIQDDLSDDSSEEILEVEINADDFSEFVQELKQINGLDTEVVCADEIDSLYNDFEPELENENDLNSSVESYQQLLKLNNIIEKKFHKNFRSINEETNKKVKEIIKKK